MGMAFGGGGRRRGRGGFNEINITPLVDVMLVLLVVFMVTAPLLTTGLRVELPQVKAHNTPVRDTKLIVDITSEEKIFFAEQDVTKNVEQVLLQSPRIQKERELYIRADKNARYGVVARVVAAARAAGVDGLNLLVEPEIEEIE
ncbi:MAG: biopolymer transporter ExbD [Deltaproteobacteria bacterium]|nr:biopolymer transporter ExbD [Deltaproteobacteria bacterium]